jgi:hypothetical protein
MIRFDLPDWQRESLVQVPEKQSAYHSRAQRNASRRRDAHLQSRSFARWNRHLVNVSAFQLGKEIRKIHFLLLVRSDLLWT